MKITYVSSCLLKNNKILIASRPKNKFLSGFWELPGGKLFKNESLEPVQLENYMKK
jgi:8-oxo-dGTP pyrophosphatase MutT (NUDIX family)